MSDGKRELREGAKNRPAGIPPAISLEESRFPTSFPQRFLEKLRSHSRGIDVEIAD